MSDYQKPCGYPVMDCALGVYVTKCENRIEALETKLAQAIEALEFYTGYDDDGSIARATLATIKGESHE